MTLLHRLARTPKGFMFDLDGTLILSNRALGNYDAIAGAAEALGELDRLGIPWIALTNGSAYAARVQAPRLRATLQQLLHQLLHQLQLLPLQLPELVPPHIPPRRQQVLWRARAPSLGPWPAPAPLPSASPTASRLPRRATLRLWR